MGLFCVNLHFRTADDRALAAALQSRGIARYRVAPARGGWTSLYEERSSQQDDNRIRALTGGISRDLRVPAIAFMVHDSDVACYWLYDKGQLLDEYNSCPDYFDSQRPTGSATGRPEVLLRYCRNGVLANELADILAKETVFAENVIEQLADALGIDQGRALQDYRDRDEDGPDGRDSDDEDGDDPESGPSLLRGRSGLAGRVAEILGIDQDNSPVDPKTAALVQAATHDDAYEIARLLAQGAAIDAEAPAPIPGGQPLAGLGQLFPAGPPKIPMTPLLAAICHKHSVAAERLLEAGADPNRVHRLFGTAMHVAAGGGEVHILQSLIDHGGDVNARNAQGQTPLEIVTIGRTSADRLAQAQAMMQAMGTKIPGFVGQLSSLTLPAAGWDECERLLRAHGAR